MLIDSLVHVTPNRKWFHTNFDASEARLLDEMAVSGIEMAVLVGLAGHISNDYVLEVVHRHPDRLIACGSFDPSAYASPQEAATQARASLQDAPFRAIKFHPRLNGYDPMDARMLAVLAEIASWQHPPKIWLDTLFYRRGVMLEKSPIHAIHTLVTLYPPLTFILLHGTGSTVIELAEAISNSPNAYIDLSFTLDRYQETSLMQDIRRLAMRFDRRLLFGSDFPEVSLMQALQQAQALLEGLPKDKVANVLGGNLARILAVA